MEKQSGREFASADLTAGAQDATLQERGLSPEVSTRSRTRRWNSGSAWLRPRIAPLAIMMAGAAGALAGRVFRLGWGPPARNGRRRAVQRRVFEQASGIVGVRPCGRGEGKCDKAGAGEHRSLLCAFPRSISGCARTFGF